MQITCIGSGTISEKFFNHKSESVKIIVQIADRVRCGQVEKGFKFTEHFRSIGFVAD